MRKFLLAIAVFASALAAGATAPQERSVSRTMSGLKEINRVQHVSAPRPKAAAPMRAEAEAPANAVEVPFTHDLGKNGAEVKNYTVFDANGDTRGWKPGAMTGYTACMLANATDVDANDDWLFSVPIHLPKGDYIVSYELGFMGTGATGVEMAVTLGTAPTVEAATTTVSKTKTYTVKDMTKYEHNVTVDTEGYYYIGLHCTTPKTAKGTLKITNLGMKSGSAVSPDDLPAAGTLTWTLAPKGELKATITYTAPTKTKGGDDLKEISKVVITSRWEVDKFTYENVKPGQVITVENVEMYQGINNRFTGVAYVGDNAGDKVEHKSIWCGADTPLAPENVKLAVNPGYTTATLTWDAVPETGEHGGYVDPEKVTYYIFDAFGTYYDPALAEVTKTSYTFSYEDLDAQDFFAYQVTAGAPVGSYDEYSTETTSNIITAGTPDALPKRESFPGGVYQDMWLGNTAVEGQMQYGTITDDYFASLFDPEDPDAPEPLKSQDGDGGFYYWLPVDKDVAYGLISTRADISKDAAPVLEFWYQGQGSLIEVYAGDEIGALDKVKTIDLKANPTTGWTRAQVALDAFKAKGAVMCEIRLVAAHNDEEHVWSVPIDNVCFRDLNAADVRIVTLNGPSAVKPGETAKFTAHVEKIGAEGTNANVSWTVNGDERLSTHLADTADGFQDTEFSYLVPFNAPEEYEVELSLSLDGETNTADNTAVATMAVTRAKFATVTDLRADNDGSNVVLSWSHPVNDASAVETVTDDFESADYTPMSISGAGEWTVYDGDGEKTYNIFRELYNPSQTQPIGFQLFDIDVAQVPDQYLPDAETHSGKRFMMAPSAQSALNDNWLISPALSGNAQTVKFYAKSFSMAWPETFEIFYSTTDNAVASLTNAVTEVSGFDTDGNVPEAWTLFEFALPEGAKHFAIHHNAYDTVALLVDDVTYEAEAAIPADLELLGYHVFRNGIKINPDLHNDKAYADKPVREGMDDGSYEFEYSVVPVYNHGVAAESNKTKIVVEKSGIENIAAPDAAQAVYYNLQGVRVDAPAKGIYIEVRSGNAAKVAK